MSWVSRPPLDAAEHRSAALELIHQADKLVGLLGPDVEAYWRCVSGWGTEIGGIAQLAHAHLAYAEAIERAEAPRKGRIV